MPGKFGHAIQLDGVDDYIDAGKFDVQGAQITLSAWIRTEAFDHLSSKDARIISKADGVHDSNHFWMLVRLILVLVPGYVSA